MVLKGDWITVGAIITSRQSFAAQSWGVEGGNFLLWCLWQECQRLSLLPALVGSRGCTRQSWVCSAPSHTTRLCLESQNGLGWRGPLKAIQSNLLPWTPLPLDQVASAPCNSVILKLARARGTSQNCFRVLKFRLSFQLMQTGEVTSKRREQRKEVS